MHKVDQRIALSCSILSNDWLINVKNVKSSCQRRTGCRSLIGVILLISLE